MISARSSPRGLRLVALASPLLACLLGGCQKAHYSENLRYPARTDLIVTKRPEKQDVDFPHSLGKLDQSIAAIPAEGGKALDPKELSPGDRKELQEALEKVFGTPADPKVEAHDFKDDVEGDELKGAGQKIDALRIDSGTLARGSIEYRWHCLHCHGLAGDGRGPTGPWVHPHPRDYRQGTFKFVSSSLELAGSRRKPRRADLHRTIEKGIEGTSMPAFNHFTRDQIEQIVSYVLHLSIRGQVEQDTIVSLIAGKGDKSKLAVAQVDKNATIEKNVRLLASRFVAQWSDADTLPPNTPPPYSYTPEQLEKDAGELEGKAGDLASKAESAPTKAKELEAEADAKTKAAAAAKDAKAATALRAEAASKRKEAAALRAGAAGTEKQAASLREGARIKKSQLAALKQGDGEAARAMKLGSMVRGYRLFVDKKSQLCVGCHKDYGRQVQFRYDTWGTLVRPANLTNPTYRGGRRPIDVYWRISGGIDPSGMAPANVAPQDYWDLIEFVQALPYPQMLPGAHETERYARFKDEKIINLRDKIYVPGKQDGPTGGH